MSKNEILKESINFIVMLEQAQKSLPYLEKKLGEVNIKMRKMKSQLQVNETLELFETGDMCDNSLLHDVFSSFNCLLLQVPIAMKLKRCLDIHQTYHKC
jgi:hypothetical protein